jgi:hypothetical protein
MSKGNGTSELVHVAEQLPAHVKAVNPLDLPADHFRAGLDRRRENRAALMGWIREALVEGTDYGRIHVVGKSKCSLGNRCKNPAHFSKPSLFKPGAEKICGMLGVTAHFPTLHDYEQAALQGVDLKQIIIRCEIHDASGNVVADGVGARALKQDYGDINKALKMAEKSAHIDATLRMAGLSEVFTQDIEDMSPAGMSVAPSPSHQTTDDPSRSASPVRQNEASISENQHKRLEARIAEFGLDRGRVKAWLRKAWNIHHLNEVPASKYSKLEELLEKWCERVAIEEEA